MSASGIHRSNYTASHDSRGLFRLTLDRETLLDLPFDFRSFLFFGLLLDPDGSSLFEGNCVVAACATLKSINAQAMQPPVLQLRPA